MPNERKVWRTVIIANLVTFALGLLITSYLQDHQELTHHVKANQMAAYAQIELLSEALDKYKKDVGHYPSTVEGLNALLINPGVIGWNGPYLKKIFIPNDPWLMPYQYRSPGVHADYDLFSYGADKAPSGEGFGKDITSWDEKKGSN
ncbi:MAG: type II secretion system major pseudopilin GspG [Nitrospirae bacterium]|nr:type II secretion system major pseudopilin GspG [Nitrospirota bacterium]